MLIHVIERLDFFFFFTFGQTLKHTVQGQQMYSFQSVNPFTCTTMRHNYESFVLFLKAGLELEFLEPSDDTSNTNEVICIIITEAQ